MERRATNIAQANYWSSFLHFKFILALIAKVAHFPHRFGRVALFPHSPGLNQNVNFPPFYQPFINPLMPMMHSLSLPAIPAQVLPDSQP